MTRFTGTLTALWSAKYRDVKCRGTNEPGPCSHGRDLHCLSTEGFRPDTCITLLILKGNLKKKIELTLTICLQSWPQSLYPSVEQICQVSVARR